MPTSSPTTEPAGLTLWRTLQAELPAERQAILQGWLRGGSRDWYLQAQDALPGWPPRHRLVAVVTLQLAFVADSKRDARIVAENTMSRAPLPAELLPALPWGMLGRPDARQFPFQVHDIFRVLDAWSADATEAVVALLPQQIASRQVLYAWLARQPPRASTLGLIADGLADKSAPVQRTCADALVSHGATSVSLVLPLLSAKAAGTRRAAAEVLGRIGAPAAAVALQAAIDVERSQKTLDAMTAALAVCASAASEG